MTTDGPGRARYSPVFVLATARSYSTVTVAMLAGHPQLYGFPELVLFSTATVGELVTTHSWHYREVAAADSRLWSNAHISGLVRTVAQLHDGSQDPPAIGRAWNWLERHRDWPTGRLMDHLLALVWPRTGLEKSPDTLNSQEALRRCVSEYPDARFIHLTRHPATAVRSLREMLAHMWPGHSERGFAVAAASAWYQGNLRAAKLLASLPGRCWLRIQAEDLLAEPADRLADVLSWLGLEYDGQILDRMLRTELWQYAGSGPAGALFGGDPKFFRDPALRPITGAAPGETDPMRELSDPMRRKIAELARYLDY